MASFLSWISLAICWGKVSSNLTLSAAVIVPALVVEATGKLKVVLSSLYIPSFTVFRFTDTVTLLASEVAPSPTTTV